MIKIELTERELKELETRLKQAKKGSALIYMDLKIIEFSHQGKKVSEIGHLLGLHPNTVRTTIKKFRVAGGKAACA